jgi:hypothetical protein
MAEVPQLQLGGMPTVDLLPPEVGMRRKERTLRSVLVFLVLVTVAVVIVAWELSSLLAQSAQNQLAAEQAKTQDILTQQQSYSELTTTRSLVAEATGARTLFTSTEVTWADIVATMKSALPPGAFITTATLTGRAPWEGTLAPTGALEGERVATISLTVDTVTLDDVAAYQKALSTEKFAAGVSPDTISNANGVFTTVFRVDLNSTAITPPTK